MRRWTGYPHELGFRTHGAAPRRSLAPVVLGMALALTACKPKGEQQEAPITRIHVDTVEVREKEMPRSIVLTGTLRGERHTDLAANAAGRVTETFVERGAEVKKGDLLAKLDMRAAALSAAEAQAQAALARTQQEVSKRECARYERLIAQNAVSQAEYDRIADQCKSSSLSVAAAQARASAAAQVVGDGQIRAPFGGIVTERWIEPGQYVRADSKVVALVSIDSLRLEFTVPEANIAAVKEGNALTFSVLAYPGKKFSGKVKYVGAAIRETTRDLVVEAEVENGERLLRPGMFVTLELLAGETKVPVVPKDALVEKDGSHRVFAVVDRRVEERVVQPGPREGDSVSILRGLRPGDKIVEKPAPTLQNGQAVD